MFDFTKLHWMSIAAMVVFSFLLGGVWYGPLFGKAWLRALGKKSSQLGHPALPMILSVLTGLVCAVAMQVLVDALGAREWIEGAICGVIASVGFVAMSTASDMAFCRMSARLWAIQSGYRISLFVVMGAVFAIWR